MVVKNGINMDNGRILSYACCDLEDSMDNFDKSGECIDNTDVDTIAGLEDFIDDQVKCELPEDKQIRVNKVIKQNTEEVYNTVGGEKLPNGTYNKSW